MIDLVVQCIATSVYTYYIMTLFVYIVRTSSSVGATPKGYGSCSTSPSLITELDNDLMAYKFTHSHIYGLQSVQYIISHTKVMPNCIYYSYSEI